MADRPAQMVCFLDPEQAPYGLLYAGSGDLTRLDDGIVRACLPLWHARDYEEIGPRPWLPPSRGRR